MEKTWAGQTKGQQKNDQAWPIKSLNSLEVGQNAAPLARGQDPMYILK